MRNFTQNTAFNGIPDNHTNIKLSPVTMANVFGILCGIKHFEMEEPETYKKFRMWGQLLGNADDEQRLKIIKAHRDTLTDLLIGSLCEFKIDNFRHLMMTGLDQAEDEVSQGSIKESQYKTFADLAKGMIDIIEAIDKYNVGKQNDDDIWEIYTTSIIDKHEGQDVIDIYIYTQ